MKANLYGVWYTIAQRPHHLAVALMRANWGVDVFTIKRIRNREPTLPYTPNINKRTLIPGTVRFVPILRQLNERYTDYIERRMFDEFTQTSADLFVYYSWPIERSSSIGQLKGRLIYDCLDDWEGFINSYNPASAKWDEKLCDRADQIWVVSRHLQEKLARWEHKVKYVPNGVDYQYFSKARELREKKAMVISEDSRPNLIYVGAMQSWFDASLIGEVAKRLKNWTISLVGPNELSADQKRYLDKTNIKFLGKRDYSELPGLLADADVAMIPFIINQLIMSTSPIKLYEYLTAGLPVVSTLIPEVLPYVNEGVVACADDAEGFAQAAEALFAKPMPDLCQEIGKGSSWDGRFIPLINELIAI